MLYANGSNEMHWLLLMPSLWNATSPVDISQMSWKNLVKKCKQGKHVCSPARRLCWLLQKYFIHVPTGCCDDTLRPTVISGIHYNFLEIWLYMNVHVDSLTLKSSCVVRIIMRLIILVSWIRFGFTNRNFVQYFLWNLISICISQKCHL